jgi:two-component sensor histidine kinase
MENLELDLRYRCSGGLIVNELLTNALSVRFSGWNVGEKIG